MSDPPCPTTKKERIKNLLERGVFPSKIADQLKTSVEYVYKVSRSQRSSGANITLARGQKTRTTSASGIRETLQTENLRFQVEHNLLLSNPPLTKDDSKLLYRLLNARYTPWEIIAKEGFHPEAVEIEYSRFLRMQEHQLEYGRAPLVNAIVSMVPRKTTPNPELDALLNLYQRNGSLSNKEVLQILIRYTKIIVSPATKETVNLLKPDKS